MFRICFSAALALPLLAFAPMPAGSAGLNNAYYSAAICQPARGSSGRIDLEFETNAGQTSTGPLIGGWLNADRSNKETLVCAVPYDKFNTKKFIVVRVVVEDGSNDQDRGGSVDVKLCGQPAEGATICPRSTGAFANIRRGEASTGRAATGIFTLSVNIQPRQGGEDLRWFFFTVSLPHIDTNVPGTKPGVSRVLGFRVLRCPARGTSGDDRFIPDCSDVQ